MQFWHGLLVVVLIWMAVERCGHCSSSWVMVTRGRLSNGGGAQSCRRRQVTWKQSVILTFVMMLWAGELCLIGVQDGFENVWSVLYVRFP
jgi:hypothetical protein